LRERWDGKKARKRRGGGKEGKNFPLSFILYQSWAVGVV